MAKKTIVVNPRLCVGCHSCEVACKQINKLPIGVFRIKVERNGPCYDKNGKLTIRFRIVRCTQCEKPRCVFACPIKALKKQNSGVVTVDKDLCNGCGECIEACPIHAIWLNPETGKIEKCDMCVDKNLEIPPCVKHCMSKALCYNDPYYPLGIPW